ncbi:MAG: hypothetical protein U5K28_03610 [Halobacteriales archaeon]|nr:hypothetical protein [Halobacteriales archaeon]
MEFATTRTTRRALPGLRDLTFCLSNSSQRREQESRTRRYTLRGISREREPRADRFGARRQLEAAVQLLPCTRPHAPRRNALLVLVYSLCLLLLVGLTWDLFVPMMVVSS